MVWARFVWATFRYGFWSQVKFLTEFSRDPGSRFLPFTLASSGSNKNIAAPDKDNHRMQRRLHAVLATCQFYADYDFCKTYYYNVPGLSSSLPSWVCCTSDKLRRLVWLWWRFCMLGNLNSWRIFQSGHGVLPFRRQSNQCILHPFFSLPLLPRILWWIYILDSVSRM